MIAVSSLAGYGGQGVLAIPNVYNSWVKNLPGRMERPVDARATKRIA